jgi:flagellar biosynthesis protein FlhB
VRVINKAEEPGNVYGITSLVLGIIGIIACFFLVGIIFSALAIIFGAIQRKRNPNGIATAGIVLGIIGAVLVFLIGIIVVGIMATYFRPAPLLSLLLF